MKNFALLLCLSVSLWARSAETVYFRAVLLPSNEVPAVNINASGAGTVRAHIVRDDSGQVTEGTVDFVASYSFPGPVTITGMHIHNGAAGANAPVTISSGLTAANSVNDPAGKGTLDLQGQVLSTDQAGVATLKGMLDDPSGYYLNIHTTDNPGGVMRGQLQRASTAVFTGLMSTANEVPPITAITASAVSSVLVISTRDASGAFTSAQMIFDVNYKFPSQVTFTGFHIHNGPAGANASVIFNTGIGSGAASVTSDASGAGNIRRPVEVDLTSQTQRDNLAGLLTNPSGFYINLHTTDYPGGVVRSQMLPNDTMTFSVTMLPGNEVPPLTVNASAPAVLTVHTNRADDGSVTSGMVEFDVNYRFPGAATMTGLHIHDGAAGGNGSVIINTGLSATNSVSTDTGFGNIYRTVTVGDTAGLATLNDLVKNPENHYVNIHTTTNPGGIMRSQLAPANTALPVIVAVFAATSDKSATTVVPGGLISIWGSNLAKVATDLSGWEGSSAPDTLNGVTVTVGGQRARPMVVSPDHLNVQVAYETPLGAQPVTVNNGNGASAPFSATVASAAPSLFFGPSGAVALKASDFSAVDASNPVRAGDVVLLYGTGLGQTTPAAATGVPAPSSPQVNTASATVTIGGAAADTVSSTAVPGWLGLDQIAVRVPAGLAAGNAQVVVTVQGASSRPATLPIGQ